MPNESADKSNTCVIEFEADLSPYMQLYLVAVDKESVVQTSVDLAENSV